MARSDSVDGSYFSRIQLFFVVIWRFFLHMVANRANEIRTSRYDAALALPVSQAVCFSRQSSVLPALSVNCIHPRARV